MAVDSHDTVFNFSVVAILDCNSLLSSIERLKDVTVSFELCQLMYVFRNRIYCCHDHLEQLLFDFIFTVQILLVGRSFSLLVRVTTFISASMVHLERTLIAVAAGLNIESSECRRC